MNILKILVILITSHYVKSCTLFGNVDTEKIKELNEIFSHKNWIELTKGYEYYKYKNHDNKQHDNKKKKEIINQGRLFGPDSKKVTSKNLNKKMRYGSIILSSIYYNVVEIFRKFQWVISFYVSRRDKFKNAESETNKNISERLGYEYMEDFNFDIKIIDKLNYFNESINTAIPLLTCMSNALNFFNYTTPVLTTLQKLIEWQSKKENIGKIDIIEIAEIMINELLEFNIFDENYVNFKENFGEIYISYGYDSCLFDPYSSNWNIPSDIQKYCIDLGFDA